MSNVNVTPDFVLAGEAIFTVSNGNTNYYTYKVYKSTPSTQFPGTAWFVKVLTKPDHYTYVGQLDVNTSDRTTMPKLRRTGRSRYEDNSNIMTVFRRAMRVIWQKQYANYVLPEPYSIKHEGHCGRCGRALTTPQSLDTGLGPECAAQLGVEWREGPRHPELPYEGPHRTRTVQASGDQPNVGSDEDRKSDANKWNQEDAYFFYETVGYHIGSK